VAPDAPEGGAAATAEAVPADGQDVAAQPASEPEKPAGDDKVIRKGTPKAPKDS
jgi:hypothetical protein